MDTKSDFPEVVDTLTWKKGSNTPALWRTRYEDLLWCCLQSLSKENEEALDIVDAVSLLTASRQRAFLRAPLVASRVLAHRQNKPFEAGPVAKSLMAELANAGIDCEFVEPVWTALGDRRIDPPNVESRSPTNIRIHNTNIVIDNAGPTDFSAPGGSRLVSPSESEWIAGEQTIAKAAREIAATSENAFNLWNECVDVIAVRTSAGPEQSFSSASIASNARLSLLRNVHTMSTCSEVVADALIHESIHSLLFMCEEINGPFVTNTKATEGLRVISPWSGRPLFLPQFIHECLVWYSLYWFWVMAMERQTWPTHLTRRGLDLARAGFEKHPLSMIPNYRTHLSADSVTTLTEIESRMASV